jgi:hypothetical protein
VRTASQATAIPVRQVLRDDFDNPGRGILPQQSSNPARSRFAYQDGVYVVAKVDPAFNAAPSVRVPDTYQDSVLSVDARLVEEAGTSRYYALLCRRQPGEASNGYRLTVYPGPGWFSLSRWDDGVQVLLVPVTFSRAVHLGFEWNNLELRCAGDTISAKINGFTVASVTDQTYQSGTLNLLAGTTAGFQGTVEAHFDNLVVTRP